MSELYTLERFGTLVLPVYGSTMTIGAPNARSIITNTATGYFDHNGTLQARRDATREVLAFALVDGSLLVQLQPLKALIGKRDKLFRRIADDDSVEWAWARCVTVNVTRQSRDTDSIIGTIEFERLEDWRKIYHGAWTFDSGEYFDAGLYFDSDDTVTGLSSPANLQIGNTGDTDAPISFTIVPAGSALTAITIVSSNGGINMTWAGSVAVGDELVINGENAGVTNDGAGAWNGLAFNSGHSYSGLLVALASDATLYTMTFTGASTISVSPEFWERLQ